MRTNPVAVVVEGLERRQLFAAGLPVPAHVVVVMLENKSYADLIGNPSAAYINSLAISGGAVHQQPRRGPPEPAELPGPVRRQHRGRGRRRRAAVVLGPRPRVGTGRGRQDVRRLQRAAAGGREHGPHLPGLRPQAQPVVRLHRRAGRGQPAVRRLPHQLRRPAHRLGRHPRPGRRHARRHHRRRRRLAADEPGRLRHLGQGQRAACWSSPATRTTTPTRSTRSPRSSTASRS